MVKKKKVRVRRSKAAMEAPEEMKPTLEIKASQLGGKELNVGTSYSVVVTGKVVIRKIEMYGPDKGKQTYTIEVTKVRMA